MPFVARSLRFRGTGKRGKRREIRRNRVDLTGDDDLMGEGGGTAGPAPTVPDNDAVPVPGDELSAPYTAQAAGADAPPWVHSLLQSIELMHRKQDCAGKSIGLMRQDVDTAKGRIDTLEEVTQYHNVAHKAAIARMDEVERELQALRARTARAAEPGARGRSPTPPLRGDRDRSPMGSRSPRDAEAEFQIVMGGWKDARRTEAEEEADKILRAAGFSEIIKECWAPYIRTTFVKITLHYPDQAATLPARRTWQMKLIQTVKSLAYRSVAPGSEGPEIWVSKQRSVEERHKIRALVVTKEFIEKLREKPDQKCDAPEIDWRGRLYVGVHQLMGNAERDEPQPEDQFIAIVVAITPRGTSPQARCSEPLAYL